MSERRFGWNWVWVPAALTLVITLIRLYGELNDLDPTYFGKEAGGVREPASAGAPQVASLFGIFWLMPLMGIYFGVRLLLNGERPQHRGKAILFPLLGTAVMVAAFAALVATRKHETDASGQQIPVREVSFLYGLALICVTGWVGVLISSRGWPSLCKLSTFYGLAARIPVIVLTFILCALEKGTHYEKLAPFAPADLSPMATAFWLSVAQFGVWIPTTVFLGTLCGGIVALFSKARPT